MLSKSANVEWIGSFSEGNGDVRVESGAFGAQFAPAMRVDNTGTNPVELVAAAYAACFTPALSAFLGRAGFQAKRVTTNAEVTMERLEQGFELTKVVLSAEVDCPGLDEETLARTAALTNSAGPVCKLFSGAEVSIIAKLI